MKGRDIFIEVDGEEVEIPDTRVEGSSVVLKLMVEVVGGFSSYRADLFVAPSVAWNEKNGNSLQ